MNKKLNGNGSVDALVAIDALGTAGFEVRSLAGAVTGMLSGINTAPSFAVGGSGYVNTGVGSYDDEGKAVAVQINGKIIVVGETFSGKNQDTSSLRFALVRYNSDGTLDTSFDGDGKLTTVIGSDSIATAVALQVDGKILAAGASDGDFALARYNSNGALDTSFDGDGKVTTDFGFDDTAKAIAIQSDGKIILAGVSLNNPVVYKTSFVMARYNLNGTLDNTFDGDGKVTADLGLDYDVGFLSSIALQTDGKILVAGSGWDSNTDVYSFVLARYNSNGSLDATFGGDGVVNTVVGDDEDQGKSVLLQTDGKIIVAGNGYHYLANVPNDFELARYNTNGTLDTSFGNAGIVITPIAGDKVWSAVLQANGKILVAGASTLVRYNTDGSLDPSFGGNGIVTITDVNAKKATITVQADGKILVSGSNYDGSYSDFALARYNPDGSLDTTFGTGAANTLNNTPTYTENGAATVLDSSVQIIDAELAAAGNYGGASVTLARHGGANAQDVFSGSGALSFSGSNAVLSGVTIGTVSNGNGTLKITFNSNATPARANAALSALAYKNSADTPPASVQIDWTFSDGNTGAQGTGGALSALGSTTVNIIAVNDAPTGTVTITGLTTQGQTLTATNTLADADGLGAITYTWKTGSTVLGTGNTYVLKNTDVTHTVTVTASYIDKAGTAESKSSPATGVVGITKTGTANADTLTGTIGNDIIYGLGGNDTLNAGNGDDTVDGGGGSDTLAGGLGNDMYVVDASGDTLTEAAGAGTDSVRSYVTFTLAGTNLENLYLKGTAAINATGNDGANSLAGNTANNILSGGAGNDTLYGDLGNDTLTGGAGQDVFRFNTALANNVDKITDFVAADDTIQLENAIFTKLTATGVLNAANLKIGGVASDANDYILYNPGTGGLYYDADGNGAGAAVQVAILGVTTHPVVTNADFVVI